MSETVLITGGTGFAGSHLVEAILEETDLPSHQLHVTTYNETQSVVHDLLPAENIHELDLTDYAATTEVLSKVNPTQIYHLASIATVGSSFEKLRGVFFNNVSLQMNLLQGVKEVVPQARILTVTSSEVYGLSKPGEMPVSEAHPFRPANPYAVSKIAQDMLSYTYTVSQKLAVIRVRPFNHIGERQAPGFVVPDFASQVVKIERGQQDKMLVGNLKAVRDFTDVKDMVRAYITLMEKGKAGEVYNAGSGQGKSIEWILQQLIESAEAEIKVEVDQSRLRPLDIPEFVADSSKLKALGWEPQIPIEQTLKRVITWKRESL